MKTTETTQTTAHTNYYLTAALPLQTLRYDRSEFNESRSREMEACIADDAGKVIAFIPGPAAMKFAPLLAAAPELLNMLERMTAEGTFGQPCLLTLEHARNAIAKANGNP